MTTNLNSNIDFSWPEIECYWLAKENNGNVLLLEIKDDGSTMEAYYCFLSNEQFCIKSRKEAFTSRLKGILSDKLLAQPAEGPEAVKWWSNLFSLKEGKVDMHEYAGELPAAEGTSVTMEKLITDLIEEVRGWSLIANDKVFVYGRYGIYLPLLYAIQAVTNSSAEGKVKTNWPITIEQMQQKCWLDNAVLDKRLNVSKNLIRIKDVLNRQLTIIIPMNDTTLDSHIVRGICWRNFLGSNVKPDFSLGGIDVKRITILVLPNGWRQVFISALQCETIVVEQDGRAHMSTSSESIVENSKEPLSHGDGYQPYDISKP